MKLVFLLLVVCTSIAASAATLDEIAANPPGTGGMIVRVMPDSQAASEGLKAGDILLSYQGHIIGTSKDLVEAVTANKSEKAELDYLRAGKHAKLNLKTGKLGVQIAAVEKGKPLVLRPPATKFDFELSLLKDNPRDQWYTFNIAGKHVGFEHERVEIKNNHLEILSEVAFDSTEFGMQHFLVRTTATATAHPALIESRYEAPLEPKGYVGTLTQKNGKLHIEVTDNGDTGTKDVSIPADAMSDYLVAQLAALMPLTTGTCLHYTMLGLTGDIEPPAGQCVGEAEEIAIGDQKIRTFPVALFSLGSKTRTAWVDPATRTIVKYEYGNNTEASRSTRDEAVAGVNANLKPRS